MIDGDLDVFIGYDEAGIAYFENTGTISEATFEERDYGLKDETRT